MSELFPAPEGPIRAHISPGCRERSIESRIRLPPRATPTPSTRNEPEADRGDMPSVDAAEDEGIHVVTSPIVGTFYRAPNPDAESYVKTGDFVEKGQVLCIVEAMKLMNEIESDVAGTIVKVVPENAEPVEYGARLFAIKPA